MKKSYLAAVAMVFVFVFSSYPYSYSAFSLMTGDNTFAVNPYVFADGTGYVGSELYLAYGLSDKADIFFSYYTDNRSYNDFSVMARYDFKNSNIAALSASPSSASIQYHTIKENDRFAIQGNISLSFNYSDMKRPDITTVIAPVIKLGSTGVDFFCEVNPALYSTNTFALDLVPGVGFTISDALFTIAAPIQNISNKASITFGAWAFFAITSR
jgi:hypothetical protein